MNWIKITLLSIMSLSAICTILAIGEEREPITPLGGAIIVIADVLMILGIIFM